MTMLGKINREVLQELQTNMQLGMSAVQAGTTPRLEGRARLLNKQKLEAARTLAAALSTSLMNEQMSTEATTSDNAVVVVSSEEEEAPHRVFDHDEEIDREFFAINKNLHRKSSPSCFPTN